MASFKIGRLSEDIKRELSLLIRELKDPRISKMLSIIRCEVSGDLSHCKVNVSALEGETATKESIKGLNSASGFLRRELGNRLHLRKCPELHFIPDGSIAYSAKINHILQELDLEEEAGDEPKE
ncbi:MAG TPA: 30S ribosome-binding factor RbfA [Candidatus Merdivicinus excrementipullorum]|uniref:Ribosome-binding factor A n=1 Tax=Candidatus Merdivicinus excrementipullorum TaxID=2840867 RepID=A0A9D1FPI7_9FIRM|nr:30S ribosome-binding factor RbfA [Candidatus Merdivicinus excrementipullorum]